MVEKSLSMLKRPNSQIDEREMDENIEIHNSIQENEPQQKKSLGELKTPNTYQGPEDPTADEGMLDYFVRNAASNASRVAEQVAGRYGNIEKFAKDTLTNLPKTGGLLGWAISELVGPEKWERMIRGPKGQEQLAPTSQQLKQASEISSGGYTKAKTRGEEKFQEFTEDVGAALTGPRQPNLTGRTAAQRATQLTTNKLLIPAAANVVKRIVTDTGFGEDKGNLAKLAIWSTLSLAGNISAPQYASNLMNQGRNGIPQNLNVNIPRLQQRLQTIANDPHLLHADPRTALARQTLADIQRDIANGQNSVRSFMTSYDGINAAKRNRGLFDLNSADRTFARTAIDRVRNGVRDEIMDAGAQHPEALNNWRSGIQAWAVIHQSNAVKNWVEGLAKGPYAKILAGPAAGLFGIGALGASKAPLVTGTGVAATSAAYKTGQTLYRIYHDPNLANYYWNAIGAAQVENAPVFISNYYKLDKELKKSESGNPKSKAKKK